MPDDPCLLILADFLTALACRQDRLGSSEARDLHWQLHFVSLYWCQTDCMTVKVPQRSIDGSA